MKKIDTIATLLILLGGINWGLIGFFNFDLLESVFGDSWLDRAMYLLIGLSAVFKIVNWKNRQNG
ncbi:MAG: DUF378 domain-containing protein [Chlamydiae bacterium RIFCSPHIGHO2_12_FULL_49_9]|nr:MAG: DUF378 domain-containing protein [Chlamydiae bacterium RIFCSPHIGHO2_12_FULL_49_9]